MAAVFFVWSRDRRKKVSFVSIWTVTSVITKASEKMQITGTQLVLEENGTLIDDDEVLNLLNNKVFILLQDDERWEKPGLDDSQKDAQLTAPVENSVDPVNNQRDTQQEDISRYPRSLKAPFNPDQENVPPIAENIVLHQSDTFNRSRNYHYDWNNLDPMYVQQLKRGDKSKQIFREVVRRVISDMRAKNIRIVSPVLKNVAKEIMETYPHAFEDTNMGRRYGTGYVTLYDALKEHNNYLNRPEKKRPPSNIKKVPATQVKLRNTVQVGTVNWQPQEHPEGETDETVADKKAWLYETYLSIFNESADPHTHDEILSCLTATFKAQRDFFNDIQNTPTVQDLTVSWPMLIKIEYMYHHYEILMGHSIEKLRNEFNKKKEAIFTYGRSKLLTEDELLDDRIVMNIIFRQFNEKSEELFKDCPVSFQFTHKLYFKI